MRLAAGPDTGVDFVPHGRLYEDIEWFVEAGLPTDDAVRIATLNGARAAGIEALPLVVVRGVVTTDVGAIEHVLLVVPRRTNRLRCIECVDAVHYALLRHRSRNRATAFSPGVVRVRPQHVSLNGTSRPQDT